MFGDIHEQIDDLIKENKNIRELRELREILDGIETVVKYYKKNKSSGHAVDSMDGIGKLIKFYENIKKGKSNSYNNVFSFSEKKGNNDFFGLRKIKKGVQNGNS